PVRFGRPELQVPWALVFLDRFQQVAGASIVKEEDALPQAPQRRGPELVALCLSLEDLVGQPRPHVVEQEIREEVDGLVVQRLDRDVVTRRQRRRVTESTPCAHEQAAAVADRSGATRRVSRGSGRRQESLEEGELLDRAQSG